MRSTGREREREDEIGGVKKKAVLAILVFTLATLEIVLKEKKLLDVKNP